MKVITFNLPSAVRELLEAQITADSALIAKQAVLNGLAKTIFPVGVPETGKGLTIEKTVGYQLRDFFTCHNEPALGFSMNSPLSTFGANYGPTINSSISDGVSYTAVDSQTAPLLCVELKDTTTSPIEQIGQAFERVKHRAATKSTWT